MNLSGLVKQIHVAKRINDVMRWNEVPASDIEDKFETEVSVDLSPRVDRHVSEVVPRSDRGSIVDGE